MRIGAEIVDWIEDEYFEVIGKPMLVLVILFVLLMVIAVLFPWYAIRKLYLAVKDWYLFRKAAKKLETELKLENASAE